MKQSNTKNIQHGLHCPYCQNHDLNMLVLNKYQSKHEAYRIKKSKKGKLEMDQIKSHEEESTYLFCRMCFRTSDIRWKEVIKP